jgi:hypothetical protein
MYETCIKYKVIYTNMQVVTCTNTQFGNYASAVVCTNMQKYMQEIRTGKYARAQIRSVL